MQHLPEIPHFACFDTIFHQTIPYQTALYAIPLAFHDQGVRKYGFHGLSCESVVRQLHAAGINPTRMIIAHLGSGCSVTALVDGKSVDNSMGLTPTGGLVMGTRPGDLDPGLVFYLLRQPGATIDSVEHMLNHESGLKAIGGVNDMRKLEEDLGQGEQHAKDGVAIFRQSLRRTLGGMVAVHGMDALVFTGGIGEHDQDIHSTGRALVGNEPMIESAPGTQQGVRTISSTASALPVYVVPADEDLMIALHVRQLYASNHS
jgi:acetate kinase